MGKVLTERTAFSGGKVGGTPDAPVVQGVLACGPVSANRRRYLVEAFKGDRINRYNGVPVGTYHADKHGHKYLEQLGLTQNARHDSKGLPLVDIAVNPEKPGAKAFLWDAEHAPRACGMSHVAHCETVTSKSDGFEEVTEIVRVESLDIISAGNAATTKSLFTHEGKRVRISLKQFSERFGAKLGAKSWVALTRLCEDDSMGALLDAPVMDEPAADAAPDEGDLKSALMAALTPFMEEAFESGSADKLCSACKDFVKLHAKHTGKGDSEDAPEEEPKDDAPPKESKSILPWDVLRECQAADYLPSPTALELLAKEADPEKRKAFVTEQKALRADANAQKPKSGARNPGASDAKGKAVAEAAAVPTDGKAFAESVKG